jgi:hypothetical protein
MCRRRKQCKTNGKVVWEAEVEAGSTATFMTYIGGQNHSAEFVAFSL